MSRLARLKGGIHISALVAVVLGGLAGGLPLLFGLTEILSGGEDVVLQVSSRGAGRVQVSPFGTVEREPDAWRYAQITQ